MGVYVGCVPESENQIGVKFDDPPTYKTGIATMSTIPSVLIRTCMLNIQKELRQLEHWLNTLPESAPSMTVSTNPDMVSTMEKLSRQYDVQQHALNHIVDRLDMLEEMREIQVNQDEEKTDPWLDSSSTYLENTIVDPLEQIYLVRKEAELFQPILTPSAVALSSILRNDTIVKQAPKEEPQEKPQEKQEEPQEKKEEPQEKTQEKTQEKKEEEPQEEPQEKAQEEQEEQEKQEEQEEQEDGIELAEVTYKGKSYYKDPEGFIYGIDEEGQPTEQPIGVWKEKSSSVVLYRT